MCLDPKGARFGSVPPVRTPGKQSFVQRERSIAIRGQLSLAELSLGLAPAAVPNVGLMALAVSTPAGGDRLLSLDCRRWRTSDRRQRGHDAHVNASLAGMAIGLGLLRERLGEINADMQR
jgi:hypothetical protein